MLTFPGICLQMLDISLFGTDQGSCIFDIISLYTINLSQTY